MRRLLLCVMMGTIIINGGEEIKIGNDEEIAPNILSKHLHGLVLQKPIARKEKKDDIRIGDKVYTADDKIKLTDFQDSKDPLLVPIQYIQYSKTYSDLLQGEIKDYTIDKNVNLFRSDTNIIFNQIIGQIRKEIPPKLNIHKICWTGVKNKSFYETLRLLQTINYLGVTVNNTSIVDIFCNLLKNKKIQADEIEKCRELKIHSRILSNIAWIESSLKVFEKPLYQSENLKISDKISLNMAINEDCSKIGVVGLTDDQGHEKITLFEKDEGGYKIRREGRLQKFRSKDKHSDHPFSFINLTFTRQNDPLLYAEALYSQYAYN